MPETLTYHTDNHFELLNQLDGPNDAHLASVALQDIAVDILGKGDPIDAVKVAFNLLHPEAPITKDFSEKDTEQPVQPDKQGVDWYKEANDERKEIAGMVLGTLLLAKARQNREGATIDRTVLGLPNLIGDAVTVPSVDPHDLADETGLQTGRIIHRKYEALESLASIWKTETGPLQEASYPNIRLAMTPKIFETYGQLGYSIASGLFKKRPKPLSHIYIYLDKTLNDQDNNPLHEAYTNGIAGYNNYAKSGRNALVKHLSKVEFQGDQSRLDAETLENMALVAQQQEKLDSILAIIEKSSRNTPEWAEESAETLSNDKTVGFDQVEAFKIAEIKLVLSSFNPRDFPPPVVKQPKANPKPKPKNGPRAKPVIQVKKPKKQEKTSPPLKAPKEAETTAPGKLLDKGPFSRESFDDTDDKDLLMRFEGSSRVRKIKAADDLNKHFQNFKAGNFDAIPPETLSALEYYYEGE